jgi:trimeric autotransporter adhesin
MRERNRLQTMGYRYLFQGGIMRLDHAGKNIWLGLLLMASMVCGIANAQRASVWSHTESYDWNSGLLSPGSKVSHVVQSPGATWMQLRFANVKLGSVSYIRLTSLQDGATQILNAKTLKGEGNLSAYFNGDRVRVELHVVAPDWSGASIRIDQVEVGELVAVAESQCGSVDNRTLSNNRAVARATNGCTAWIISNGNLLTAGHCVSGLTRVEFNVPSSTSGGGLVRSNPRDQYTVVPGSVQSNAGQVGNDWAVFRVQNNSQTGLSPLQAQGASFNLTRRTALGTIRVTGHGVDGGTRNQVQQTHTGPLTSLSGTRLRYVVDTEGGNSGSPVIDEATGEAVGIHTHGGCTTSGGSNNGTHASLTALWNAANSGGGGGTSVTVQENATGFCGVDGIDSFTVTGNSVSAASCN